MIRHFWPQGTRGLRWASAGTALNVVAGAEPRLSTRLGNRTLSRRCPGEPATGASLAGRVFRKGVVELGQLLTQPPIRLHRPHSPFPVASLLCVGAWLALAFWAGTAWAAGDERGDTELTASELITPETQKAIDRGLQFLARQQHDDGSFGSGGYSRNVAVCGLAGMAFMSGGSTPDRGPYGSQVTRCVEFILKNCQDGGFIDVPGSSSHGPMYGHGFATLFLAESYGMSMKPVVRERLAKAVELIVNTQNKEGGWRYQPVRHEADISVTICQIMALRAARNAGIFVPRETIDHCVEYVKKSQNPDGGFMYMSQGGQSAFPRSAAGVVALYSAGVYEGPEIDKGLDYLMGFLPNRDAVGFNRETHYFYGHYYAAQAMWHAGGKHWQQWYPAIRDELLARQRGDDGAWMDSICQEYGTAMACIILQMPNNYLPIFQR